MRNLALLFALIGGLAPARTFRAPIDFRGKLRDDPITEERAQAKRERRQARNLWLVERGGLKAI